MSSIEKMTDEQFERHALDVLRRELGVDSLARFPAITPIWTWRLYEGSGPVAKGSDRR